MPPVSTLLVFATAALALLVVPGPSVLYIVTRSIDQGRRAGVASVLGIHTGSLVHIAAAAAGVSAVLAASATAFTTVKLAGAVYLVFIGVRRLIRREHGGDGNGGPRPRDDLRRVYAQGVVVNVLNPKTALFFLAFLPQFVDPNRGPVAVQIAILGVLFIALGFCSDGTYAMVAGTLGRRLRESRRLTAFRDRWSGLRESSNIFRLV